MNQVPLHPEPELPPRVGGPTRRPVNVVSPKFCQRKSTLKPAGSTPTTAPSAVNDHTLFGQFIDATPQPRLAGPILNLIRYPVGLILSAHNDQHLVTAFGDVDASPSTMRRRGVSPA